MVLKQLLNLGQFGVYQGNVKVVRELAAGLNQPTRLLLPGSWPLRPREDVVH